MMWSKQRIMEVYLNSIEMGPVFILVLMRWLSIISQQESAGSLPWRVCSDSCYAA